MRAENIFIEDIELSTRTLNVLRSEHMKTLADVIKLSPQELLRSPNCGKKSLAEIRNVLKQHGIEWFKDEKRLDQAYEDESDQVALMNRHIKYLKETIYHLEKERGRLVQDIERYRDDILQLHERLKYQSLPSAFVTGDPFK